jgi:hypothetical protein
MTRLSVGIGLFLLTWFGCATPTLQVPTRDQESKWIAFLEDGKTTREDVLLRLGLPSGQFEGQRILTYRMMLSEKEGLVVVSRELSSSDPRLIQWAKAEYSLVLVFDGRHVLQRHSLLRVK